MKTIQSIASAILVAGVSLSSLAQAETGDLKKGSAVFESSQCFTCHPGGGNVINPNRPLKGKEFLKRFPEDAQIAELVRNGNPGTAMPAYSTDRLSNDDMTDLISYIRSLSAETKRKHKP